MTHAGMLPTLARHPRKLATHATYASTPPTLARIARHFSNSQVIKQKNFPNELKLCDITPILKKMILRLHKFIGQ